MTRVLKTPIENGDSRFKAQDKIGFEDGVQGLSLANDE